MTRRAVVSGGGTGIGKAVAARLAAQGCAVVILGRRGDVLAKAVAELNADLPGPRVSAETADLTEPDEVERAGRPARGGRPGGRAGQQRGWLVRHERWRPGGGGGRVGGGRARQRAAGGAAHHGAASLAPPARRADRGDELDRRVARARLVRRCEGGAARVGARPGGERGRRRGDRERRGSGVRAGHRVLDRAADRRARRGPGVADPRGPAGHARGGGGRGGVPDRAGRGLDHRADPPGERGHAGRRG